MASEKTLQILEEIKGLTILEMNDLVKGLEEAFGVTADEVQALLDYGCSEEEIEEMLYDPELFHEMTGELLYAY